jgi:hypothetical protein
MTENGKTQIQAIGAGLIGFVVVVGAGALIMFPHGAASVKAPLSSYAPVDVNSGLAAPTAKIARAAEPAMPAPEAAPQSSPAPLLSDDARDPDSDASAPAAAPQASAPASQASAAAPKSAATMSAPKLVVTQHLDGSSSAHSSAKAAVAAAPTAFAARPAKKAALAPKMDFAKAAQGTVASSVHYGVSDRAELMGRAAGPVYNFSGGAAGKTAAPQVGEPTGAIEIDSIQKDIDNSALNDADKSKLKAQLDSAARVVSASKKTQL